ncbi:MAG: prenyltransferase [Candidatus Caldarchaeales archaeon]
MKIWMEVIRTKFFLAGIPPVVLGTSIALQDLGKIDLSHFLLALIGIIFVMIGTYTFNEYYDYRSGVDVIIRKEDVTPFNAGSRVLPSGLLEPISVFKVGIISWIVSTGVAIYFTLIVGPLILIIYGIGLVSGAFYTAPPARWAYRGLGETLIGLNYGPLITFGSYYIQTGRLPLIELLIPSLIPGILITAVIWINEFPDYHADKTVGKNNLVARIGRKRARIVYLFLTLPVYIVLAAGILMNIIPLIGLITLITAPIIIRNIIICVKHYEESQKLKPAMAGTILAFTLTTLLLAASYMLASIL